VEQIEIKGFLTIEHAVFEIKKINILIGEQAQGKSVIAKLVYFFKSHFTEIFLESIRNLETEQEIEEKCLAKFRRIFPAYTWAQTEFSILYQKGESNLSLTRIKSGDQYILRFTISPNLHLFWNKACTDYEQALQDIDEWMKGRQSLTRMLEKEKILETVLLDVSKELAFEMLSARYVFIPAGRSFFAMLQKNIFSLLSKELNIDPFMEEFGRQYEEAKKRLQDTVTLSLHDLLHPEHRSRVERFCADIVKGEYVYRDNQDWIQDGKKHINLANASSGQQESLPMLLMLRVSFSMSGFFVIEEPEAHLFPHAQKQVVSLIATIYKELGHSFFITTHSPYILTAINSLILGQDAYDKVKDHPEKLAQLEAVLPASQLIRLEDVSAYTLKNGKLESLIDWENRLIGANLLDAVSSEFEQIFNVASDMLYGAE
jgi:predicted ATPase